MALMAVLESDLRALSAESRRKYPAVKDAAEHAILKLRSLCSPSEIAENEDILRIFLMACEVKTVKLSVIGLSCIQKLISHDAVAPSALKPLLSTLKDHAEMSDESVQLKTLQTILILFQSRLQPDDEDTMAQALGICLRLLESNRSLDSVRNTAAATLRQAVALIFDHVVCAESLPVGKSNSRGYLSRSSSVTIDVNRSVNRAESLDQDISAGSPLMRATLTKPAKLGLKLLEDLTALAAGGSAMWLRVSSIQRTFALDILEFVLSNYIMVFRTLVSYEQVLRHQICSLLMTSLRTNAELDGEVGEPYFRRLVLRSVSHVIRLYGSSLVTECEVFLSMLVRFISLDLPLWHQILVLEVLRSFCVEARTLRVLFQNFDMNPKNTNVVDGMVKALARVVQSVQVPDTSEESLAAVAGMFTSKAKGIEWILDNDASNTAVLIASEAHAISLAIEGLLGVVFTVATLTDEAVDVGEVESPRGEGDSLVKCSGKTAALCTSLVDTTWLTILDALSLILSKSQGEAIVLEILKGYQAYTQACGVLGAVEPLNSFLASLCKFTINFAGEFDRRSVLQSPGSKRIDVSTDQRENLILTPKNVQALRTLFNVAHRLYNVLGPSWVLVLETLAALDRAIHSPHATTQEVSSVVPKLTKESSSHYSDFTILSSLNSQLFESSAMMHMAAVKSLLTALCQLSHQCLTQTMSGSAQTPGQKIGNISFSVERMISILVNNLHRVEPLWDQVVRHLLELADSNDQQLRNVALDALDQCICAVLGSEKFQENAVFRKNVASYEMETSDAELKSLECAVVSPLRVLYLSTQSNDVRIGSLKILLHVMEGHGEKLHYSWPNILELLRFVADASEKDLVTLGFQCLRVIMNDGISTIPPDCLNICVDVAGSYSSQKTELNISLTAIGLLWTTTDFIAKGLLYGLVEEKITGNSEAQLAEMQVKETLSENQATINAQTLFMSTIDRDKLLISVFSLLQNLGGDERPEVRNSAVRTLFQTLGSHGQKLSKTMWDECMWNYVFPILDSASHMAATSSKDEWQGKELGTRGGKAVHMLIHHSRNTAQKQWDETLVLVLGGIARLLRSFFPFLRSLSNFWPRWELLLCCLKNSIRHGSKEVALAAINCLQTTVVSHSPKGNLPLDYLKSILDVYEGVLQQSSDYNGTAAGKVKQEILHSLGELYTQAQGMFDEAMYTRLLALVHVSVKQSMVTNSSFEAEFGHASPVQRTMLSILPQLYPGEHLSSTWSSFLGELLQYLPTSASNVQKEDNIQEQTSSEHIVKENYKHAKSEMSNGSGSVSFVSDISPTSSISSYLLAEKLVPVIVDLSLRAPTRVKYNIIPDVVQGLQRCMTTRRENPEGALWRLAIQGFNRIIVEDVSRLVSNGTDPSIGRPVRIRFWKEVADVYEIFLVGYCGRALSSNYLPATMLKADESLEMNILDIFGDKILKSQIDAPHNILQRLVLTLDRCASRTCCLPIETVELMPSHCSRFSLTCLHKLFSLTSYNTEANDLNSARFEAGKIAITILLTRCEYILRKFLVDENDLGDRPLPPARLEEITFVLEELSRIVIHSDTASVLPLNFSQRGSLQEINRPHLFVLFPAFCELIVSREGKVRELVRTLLRLISVELKLEKISLGG